MSRAAVDRGGPAGLIAAERLAAAGVRVTVYDRMPSVGRKVSARRPRRPQSHPQRAAGALPRPLSSAARGAARGDRGVSAAAPARLVRGAGPADLRRHQRPGVSQGDEGVAAAARLAAPARRRRRHLRDAPPLRRMAATARSPSRDRTARSSPIGRTPPSWRSAARAGRGSARTAAGPRRWRRPASRSPRCGPPIAASGSDWSEPFRSRRAGAPLKRIAVTFAGQTVRGEAVITADGIEGGAIYALSGSAPRGDRPRRQRAPDGRPASRSDTGRSRRPPGRTRARAQGIALDHAAQERQAVAGRRSISCGKPPSARAARSPGCRPAELAAFIKAVPLRLTGVADIARAISTAGGVSFDEIDEHFMLRKQPGVFVAGEMLDWEAPTGGYLLQASFATGVAAAEGALACLKGTIEQATSTPV